MNSISVAVAVCFFVSIVSPSTSFAGNKKLKRALAIGVAVGIGAAIAKKLKKKKRAARKKKRSTRTARTKSRSSSRSTNVAIQNALNARGFNAGTPDGVLGKGSRSAIRSYQSSIGQAPTGKLTKAQRVALVGAGGAVAVATSINTSCTDPMGAGQLQKVSEEFRRMTPGGDGFKIDKCRNITITYGKKSKTGKLHQLFTELNHSHHDVTYYGLIKEGRWWVYGSDGDIYIYHRKKTKPQSAKWMVDMNTRTQQLLKLAGYKNDPHAKKRATILKRDLERLGRPDVSETLGALFSAVGTTSANSNAPRYQIVENNMNQSSFKNIVVRCRDGSRQTILKREGEGWGVGLINMWRKTFEEAARSACP